MTDLGLEYDNLSNIRLEVIMVSVTPFVQDGPYKDYKTSDLVAKAIGGGYICAVSTIPHHCVSASPKLIFMPGQRLQ